MLFHNPSLFRGKRPQPEFFLIFLRHKYLLFQLFGRLLFHCHKRWDLTESERSNCRGRRPTHVIISSTCVLPHDWKASCIVYTKRLADITWHAMSLSFLFLSCIGATSTSLSSAEAVSFACNGRFAIRRSESLLRRCGATVFCNWTTCNLRPSRRSCGHFYAGCEWYSRSFWLESVLHFFPAEAQITTCRFSGHPPVATRREGQEGPI